MTALVQAIKKTIRNPRVIRTDESLKNSLERRRTGVCPQCGRRHCHVHSR